MRIIVTLLIVALLSLLAISCSDKQKEAERLEQELRDMEAGETTSAAAPQAVLVDTTAASGVGDVGAIPMDEAEVSEPLPQAPQGGGYTVQVAACESAEYARHLVKKYQDRGYEPFVSTISVGDQTYHRVRIGSLGSMSEAKALRDELIDKYSLSPWIDRL